MADDASNGSERFGEGGEPEQEEAPLEAWSRRAGRFIASAAARAREEAEDLIAEAQAIRRGERE